jgi:hypothetical protein
MRRGDWASCLLYLVVARNRPKTDSAHELTYYSTAAKFSD